VSKQVLRLLGGFDMFEVSGAGDQLVAICQQLPAISDESLSDPRRKTRSTQLGDMVDETVRYQDVHAHIGTGRLKGGDQWHQQRIGNARWR